MEHLIKSQCQNHGRLAFQLGRLSLSCELVAYLASGNGNPG